MLLDLELAWRGLVSQEQEVVPEDAVVAAGMVKVLEGVAAVQGLQIHRRSE